MWTSWVIIYGSMIYSPLCCPSIWGQAPLT
nr:MAG TPA: hypothetical protein [Caudoviricetes sp.]